MQNHLESSRGASLLRQGRERAKWLATVAALGCLAVGTPITAGVAEETKPVSAADLRSMDLDELLSVKVDTVYGASKRIEKLGEAPSSVTIITADDFKQRGYRNLADALRGVGGIYVSNDRNYSVAGVRGFSRPGDLNSRVLVLVDGHRINENIYDGVYLGNDLVVDSDLLERVEIIRGPGSALYGGNAFFGVINLVTRRGRDLNGVETSFDAGSFDTYKGRVSVGRGFSNGLEVFLSGSFLDSAGPHSLYFPEYDTPRFGGGRAVGLDDERARSGLATIKWEGLTLQAALNQRDKGVPTASFDSYFGDSRERTMDSVGYLDLSFEHEFENELSLLARVSFNRYRYDGTYPLNAAVDPAPPDIVLNQDRVLGQWVGSEVQLSRALGARHKITAGVEYRENLDQNVLNYDLSSGRVRRDLRYQSRNGGFFVQDSWTLFPSLVLNGGARYDHYERFGESINPRAALIYHPWEMTGFKFLWGEAFRPPNVWEALVEDPSTRANPLLKPEHIRTAEMVYEQELPHRMAISVAVYFSQIDDLINQRTDPVTGLEYNDNLAGAEARGVEFGFTGSTSGGFRGGVSYALQETVDVSTSRILDNSPTHLGKAHVVVPLYRDVLFAGLELQYTSALQTLGGRETDPAWLVNLTLFSQKIAKGLEISGTLYNLLDENYRVPAGAQHRQDVIPQDGRTFRVKLTYRF